jgi:hypothetical protein
MEKNEGGRDTILEQQRIEWREEREGEERGPQLKEGSDEKLREWWEVEDTTQRRKRRGRGRGRGREEKKRKGGRWRGEIK